MIINFGNAYVNSKYILYFKNKLSYIELYMHTKDGNSGVLHMNFESYEELKKYINDVLIPSCDDNEILDMKNQIINLQNKINEMENSFKYIAGGTEFQKAFKEYHEIISKSSSE